MKIRDLTVREIKRICKNQEKCYNCNLKEFCNAIANGYPSSFNDNVELKQHLLTKEEKEYLSTVITPFRNSIKTISIIKRPEFNHFEIKIIKKKNSNNAYIFLPLFEKKDWFNNLAVDREYTLDELGLYDE